MLSREAGHAGQPCARPTRAALGTRQPACGARHPGLTHRGDQYGGTHESSHMCVVQLQDAACTQGVRRCCVLRISRTPQTCPTCPGFYVRSDRQVDRQHHADPPCTPNQSLRGACLHTGRPRRARRGDHWRFNAVPHVSLRPAGPSHRPLSSVSGASAASTPSMRRTIVHRHDAAL